MDQNNIPEGTKRFLHGLMIEKGLDTLPGNVQGDMLYDLYIRFNDYLMLNFVKNIDADKEKELSGLIESEADFEKIEEFMKSAVDYEALTRETAQEFRSIYLGEEKK